MRTGGVEVAVRASRGGMERNRGRREGGKKCHLGRLDGRILSAATKRGGLAARGMCQKRPGLLLPNFGTSFRDTVRGEARRKDGEGGSTVWKMGDGEARVSRGLGDVK